MAIHLSDGSDDLPVNHEINVTPFIDVMLVLLIIFMVAAPLATVDVKVDLPVSNAAPAPKPEKPVFLSIQADGAMSVNDLIVTEAEIGAAVQAATQSDREQRIFFAGGQKRHLRHDHAGDERLACVRLPPCGPRRR